MSEFRLTECLLYFSLAIEGSWKSPCTPAKAPDTSTFPLHTVQAGDLTPAREAGELPALSLPRTCFLRVCLVRGLKSLKLPSPHVNRSCPGHQWPRVALLLSSSLHKSACHFFFSTVTCFEHVFPLFLVCFYPCSQPYRVSGQSLAWDIPGGVRGPVYSRTALCRSAVRGRRESKGQGGSFLPLLCWPGLPLPRPSLQPPPNTPRSCSS